MNEYSPLTSEFASAEEEQEYLRWLQAKVDAARRNPRPPIPHDQVMAEIRQLIAGKTPPAC